MDHNSHQNQKKTVFASWHFLFCIMQNVFLVVDLVSFDLGVKYEPEMWRSSIYSHYFMAVTWSLRHNDTHVLRNVIPTSTSHMTPLTALMFLWFVFSDYLFKLLLIGDSGVGKSCLLLRFAVSYWPAIKMLFTHTGSDSASYSAGDLTVKVLRAKGEGCHFCSCNRTENSYFCNSF